MVRRADQSVSLFTLFIHHIIYLLSLPDQHITRTFLAKSRLSWLPLAFSSASIPFHACCKRRPLDSFAKSPDLSARTTRLQRTPCHLPWFLCTLHPFSLLLVQTLTYYQPGSRRPLLGLSAFRQPLWVGIFLLSDGSRRLMKGVVRETTKRSRPTKSTGKENPRNPQN